MNSWMDGVKNMIIINKSNYIIKNVKSGLNNRMRSLSQLSSKQLSAFDKLDIAKKGIQTDSRDADAWWDFVKLFFNKELA